MPAVSHQCHPSAASVSCNSVSPEPRCKSVSCCSNVKYVKPGDSLTCQPSLSHGPGVRKHPRLIHLQQDECHYLHLPLISQIKATAILNRIAANSRRAIAGMPHGVRVKYRNVHRVTGGHADSCGLLNSRAADRPCSSQGRSWLRFTLMKAAVEFISECLTVNR